jgi:hypothetical protein
VFSASQTTSKKKLPVIFEALKELQDVQREQQLCSARAPQNAESAVLPQFDAVPAHLLPPSVSSPVLSDTCRDEPCSSSAAPAAAAAASGLIGTNRSAWLHLTGTHVSSQAGRLYKFSSALEAIPPTELASFDPDFVRAMNSQASPVYAPSVSTILAATVVNDGLKFWRQKVGEEEADRVSSTASARGTVMHAAIEQFLTQSGTDGEARDLVASAEAAGNELLLSMSSVINSIAKKDSR